MLDRPKDAQLDNSLAEFTDSLLNDGILPEPDETLWDDLRDLQDMVSTLWQTLGSEEPESAMSVRIKNNLMAVWQETYSSPDRDKPSLWEQVR
nr:hypothetical protein [Anaerolineae bacterium]